MDYKNWPIKTEIILQWGDMDAFSHVNNINYIKWCETSRIELFREMWGKSSMVQKDIIEGDGVGPILANFNINYRVALVYPDTAIIYTRVSKVGNSSYGVEHVLCSEKNGDNIVADATSVIVMFDYVKNVNSKLTKVQKEKLSRFMV
tara:strand:- start:14 stop:454 length:441 start_codon:yes stop_codon:yes gene_type:complete